MTTTTIIKKHTDEKTLVPCACGCGQMIRRFTWGRERRWALGHHKRLIFAAIGSAATRTIRAFSLTDDSRWKCPAYVQTMLRDIRSLAQVKNRGSDEE
jgi:hypothetical protein